MVGQGGIHRSHCFIFYLSGYLFCNIVFPLYSYPALVYICNEAVFNRVNFVRPGEGDDLNKQPFFPVLQLRFVMRRKYIPK